ncbi:MAG: segregation/condensation protein A [Proteobacteria bacterium]|nr:segregation/condensation protein A [Pseudomonadota bacterium]
MDYEVKLDSFEGPLDLLLHLIKKHEVDIIDIPISMITQQYLESIEMMQMLDLDIAGEFILMAATLMHIKSKMLLPPGETEEGDEDEGDPREELVRRLLEYRKYKEAAQELDGKERLGRDSFLRGFFEDMEDNDEDEAIPEIGLFDLVEALKEVLKTVSEARMHEVHLEPLSVQEKMLLLCERLQRDGSVTFQALFEKDASRADVIATFLGLLELIKEKTVKAFQGETFGVIRIMANETLH